MTNEQMVVGILTEEQKLTLQLYEERKARLNAEYINLDNQMKATTEQYKQAKNSSDLLMQKIKEFHKLDNDSNYKVMPETGEIIKVSGPNVAASLAAAKVPPPVPAPVPTGEAPTPPETSSEVVS